MKKILDERLIYEILSVVEEIPLGKVATYGQIARLIGREKNARPVAATVWSITPEDWSRAGMNKDCFY